MLVYETKYYIKYFNNLSFKETIFLIVTTIRDKIFETKKRIQVKLDRTIKRSHLNFHTFLTATARKFLSEKENGH